MKISMPMLLFWVAIVLVPIVVSIAAIGIVPNDQSIPMRWDEPDKRNYRIICIAGALVCASFAIIVAVSWSQALIATTY